MNSDPRVFFAAERTLLAWVRSGIAVMALGFVVAKFGLLMTLLANADNADSHIHQGNDFSNVFGIALVMIGVAIILGAQYNHYLYVKTLPPADVPKLAITWLGSLLTLSVALVGGLLAVYLALT